MNSATKVAEIFTAAGQAFNRLGELTMNLPNNDQVQSGSQIKQNLKKKAYEDAGIAVKQVPVQNVQQLTAVTTTVLNQQPIQTMPQTIHIQTHPHQTIQGQTVTVQQIPQLKTISTTNSSDTVVVDPNTWAGSTVKSGDMMMTLNRLNTQEVEVDAEGLASDGVKLEFTTEEEVAG
ncbi:C17orf49 family protein [Megaselia abdita]